MRHHQKILKKRLSAKPLSLVKGNDFHAAVVARGMGTCCVAGCGELNISEENKILPVVPLVLTEGRYYFWLMAISGRIYSGEIPTSLVEHNQDLQRLLSGLMK